MTASNRVSDSYGSWCLAIRAWREIRVRSGEYAPINDKERRWASEGPVKPSELDASSSKGGSE